MRSNINSVNEYKGFIIDYQISIMEKNTDTKLTQ